MNRAETLQHLAWLCRNGRTAVAPVIEASGWAELDAVLPGGGWQAGTIVELIDSHRNRRAAAASAALLDHRPVLPSRDRPPYSVRAACAARLQLEDFPSSGAQAEDSCVYRKSRAVYLSRVSVPAAVRS